MALVSSGRGDLMREINFRYSENLDRAILVTSPMPIKGIENKSVFLAGTIDEGNSIDWQTSLISQIADLDVTILNPRRKIWDNFCDIDSAYFNDRSLYRDWETRCCTIKASGSK